MDYQYVYIVYVRDTGPKAKKDSGAIKKVYYYGQPAQVKPPDDGCGVVVLFTARRFDDTRRFRIEEGRLIEAKVRTKFVKSRFAGDGTGGEERRLDIVLVSDRTDDPTGFGTQMGFLYRGLSAKGHNIHALHFDEADNLLNLRFDWVISLGDYYQVSRLAAMGEEVAKRWIHWLPISSDDIEEGFWRRISQPSDDAPPPRHIVAMSQFGMRALMKRGLSNVSCVPHGIEMDVFKPLLMHDVDTLRREHMVDGHFVVIFVGRNTKRKRVDHLLTIFAKMLQATGNGAKIKFILKTEEKYSHISVTEFAASLDAEFGTNLKDHYLLFDEKLMAKQLNELYNMAHVGISATGGEGFGLTTLECVAAGVPVIIGRHSTSEEILNDTGQAGSLIDIEASETDNPSGVEVARAIMSVAQAVDVLLEFYKLWESGQTPNRRVVRAQVAGRYGVSTMVDLWDNLLIDLALGEDDEDGASPASYRRMTDLQDPISLPEI